MALVGGVGVFDGFDGLAGDLGGPEPGVVRQFDLEELLDAIVQPVLDPAAVRPVGVDHQVGLGQSDLRPGGLDGLALARLELQPRLLFARARRGTPG